MSAVFYHSDEQKNLAEESLQAYLRHKNWEKVSTLILPVGIFTLAEDYHQKYSLQSKQTYIKALKLESETELINSTPAARINGFVGGHGSMALLKKELESYQLPPNLQNSLQETVQRTERIHRPRGGCSAE